MIKRIALLLTALTLALTLSLGTLAVSPHEAAAAPENAAQFCQEEGREELARLIFFFTGVPVDVSQGACVSLLRAENPTALIVNFCQTEEGRAFLSRLVEQEVENTGQCVNIFKSFLRS